MPTYAILLRAVNLAGHGKIAMSDLRKMLASLGFERVETYIQSGNAVVDAKAPADKVAKAVSLGLEKLMGASPGVILRTHEQLARVIRENPFAAEVHAEGGAKVHVAFLSGPAGPAAKAALQRIVDQYPNRRDRYYLAGDHIYFHLPDGAAETKFSGRTLDKAIGVLATGRNWNTVLKLFEMTKL